jgi:hypothetical protein
MGTKGTGTQVDNGKAFEYAVAVALSESLNVPVTDTPEFRNCEASFNRVSSELKIRFPKAAKLAVDHITGKESQKLSQIAPQRISVAGDSEGQKGDVRDVIIKGTHGEIGISCKTNHDAFKHSRLSHRIDFVKSWGLDEAGCSKEYWDKVRPLFAELGQIREDSAKRALWSDQLNVPDRFYWPVLDAFEAEILRLTGAEAENASEVSKKLVSYIIGNQDFYKVICRPEQVEIQGFNLNGTLSVPKTKFPDHVLGIDRLNGGQYSKTVRFNRGYTFNFRIHSASSRVEPSLKFDVKAIALPPSEIYTNHISLGS